MCSKDTAVIVPLFLHPLCLVWRVEGPSAPWLRREYGSFRWLFWQPLPPVYLCAWFYQTLHSRWRASQGMLLLFWVKNNALHVAKTTRGRMLSVRIPSHRTQWKHWQVKRKVSGKSLGTINSFLVFPMNFNLSPPLPRFIFAWCYIVVTYIGQHFFFFWRGREDLLVSYYRWITGLMFIMVSLLIRRGVPNTFATNYSLLQDS